MRLRPPPPPCACLFSVSCTCAWCLCFVRSVSWRAVAHCAVLARLVAGRGCCLRRESFLYAHDSLLMPDPPRPPDPNRPVTRQSSASQSSNLCGYASGTPRPSSSVVAPSGVATPLSSGSSQGTRRGSGASRAVFLAARVADRAINTPFATNRLETKRSIVDYSRRTVNGEGRHPAPARRELPKRVGGESGGGVDETHHPWRGRCPIATNQN